MMYGISIAVKAWQRPGQQQKKITVKQNESLYFFYIYLYFVSYFVSCIIKRAEINKYALKNKNN